MQLVTASTLLVVLVYAGAARAAPVWVGDFETGDTSQWNGELNGPGHISVVTDPVVQGTSAARIQLTNDAVWPNGLKRVELHHSPAAGRTADGAQTYFAWSFYLPETLPTDPSQQIGYWESNNSYQQIMAFNVAGEHMQFITQLPSYTVHWDADAMATAGVWHRIAMHIAWSKDPGLGSIDVWFDGTQVVTGAVAQTLPDDNDAFTQVGLLRGAIEFSDMPVIVLDNALEGDTLDDVDPQVEQGGGGAGAGGSSSSGGGGQGSSSGGSSNEGGQSQASGGSSTGGGATGGGGSGSGEDDGCSCREAESAPPTPFAVMLAATLALAFKRRARKP